MFACVDLSSQNSPPSFEYLRPSDDKSAVEFYKSTGPILSRLFDSNPNYKQEVSSAIFRFVQKIAGEDAPKITALLSEKSLLGIKELLVDYDYFLRYVSKK